MTIKDIDLKIADGSRVFFTSDTHWNHAKIMEYCSRPFKTVEEMNETMIKNWNDCVSQEDYIFHLGDFAYGGSAVWLNVLPRLNGHKYLIVGNHDRQNWRKNYGDWFDYVSYQMFIAVEDKKILLSHLPYLCFPHSYKGSESYWNLHGHVHSGKYRQPESMDPDIERITKLCFPTQYDVGVDNNDFKPVSFYEVKDIIEKKQKKETDGKR